jgi:hypothetical protein
MSIESFNIVNTDDYFVNFKPKFNKERFKELMNNTPTNFPTEFGNVNARKEFVQSVLTACSLLNQKLDRNNLYVGREGTGKSHAVFQHTFIWWWCLNELGMINYKFTLKLIYFRLQDLINAFDHYKNIPYMIFSLDESDELNRKNWNKKIVKVFMSKLRRERKNLRIVNMLMPQLYEMLPDIILTRINWVIELEMDLDDNYNLLRGTYKLFCIPVGKYIYNYTNYKLTQLQIVNMIQNKLYDTKEKFFTLNTRFMMFRGNVNSTMVFDEKEYLNISRQMNAAKESEEEEDINYSVLKALKVKYKITYAELAPIFNTSGEALSKRVQRRVTSAYVVVTE